jgi:hypothetical protein
MSNLSELTRLTDVVRSPSAWDNWSNYVGQTTFDGWYSVVTRTRDSDCLARCNFDAILDALGGEDEERGVTIHRFGHWACGWWEVLAIHESSPHLPIAAEAVRKLAAYPVYDEDALSEAEHVEASEVWRHYTVKERIAFMRRHASECECQDWSDLRAAIQGQYFPGDPSRLLY